MEMNKIISKSMQMRIRVAKKESSTTKRERKKKKENV